MGKNMIKIVLIGFTVGALVSILYSFLTVSAIGRNMMTGEPMRFRGFQAIYVFINENGLAIW